MFCNFSDVNHVDHTEADGLMLVKYRQFSFAVSICLRFVLDLATARTFVLC